MQLLLLYLTSIILYITQKKCFHLKRKNKKRINVKLHSRIHMHNHQQWNDEYGKVGGSQATKFSLSAQQVCERRKAKKFRQDCLYLSY